MPALARGQASDCSYPEIDVYMLVASQLMDVAVLEFQIFENVTDPDNPIQVYPISGRATVLVDDLCPVGDKVSTGRYVARWTPGLAEPIGTHEVRWFYKLTLASLEQSFREEFEVLPEVTAQSADGYTTVQAMRDEGVTTGMASDSKLQGLIRVASQMIDRWTGRWFEPRSRTFIVDGPGADTVMLNHPICAISDIQFLSSDLDTGGPVELAGVRIYNRHLTQLLLSPDDRENPRLEWATDFVQRHCPWPYWPRGNQNIQITGIFGYTDPDGVSPYGSTPVLIEQACKMLVVRLLTPLGNAQAQQDQALANRITKMRTRDQEITWAAPSTSGGGGTAGGAMSGDIAIDRILAGYVRPMLLGSTS
mgnify:CR=1 FL=1